MRPLRHPTNYGSLQEYREHLVKYKEILVGRLQTGMRYGLCTKEILEMLKYIWIMLFWVDHTGNVPAVIEYNPDPITPPDDPDVPISEIGPFLKIDSTHFLLIDLMNKLKI